MAARRRQPQACSTANGVHEQHVARQPRHQHPSGVATFYDQYFPPSRLLGIPWYGGYLGAEPGDPINRLNKDNYELFSVGGIDFLIIHLETDMAGYAVELGRQDHRARTRTAA